MKPSTVNYHAFKGTHEKCPWRPKESSENLVLDPVSPHSLDHGPSYFVICKLPHEGLILIILPVVADWILEILPLQIAAVSHSVH